MRLDVARIILWVFELSLDDEIRPIQVIRVVLGKRGPVVVAGDGSGRIHVSVDGSTWTAANGAAVVGSNILTLAAYHNKIYAGDNNGKVYVSTDGGTSWNAANANTAVAMVTGKAIQTLAPFNGMLFAGDSAGTAKP